MINVLLITAGSKAAAAARIDTASLISRRIWNAHHTDDEFFESNTLNWTKMPGFWNGITFFVEKLYRVLSLHKCKAASTLSADKLLSSRGSSFSLKGLDDSL